MSQDSDSLIELSILRDEVQHLKAYAIRLERENAALMDRLSYRRPSNAAIERNGWLRQRLGGLLPFGVVRSAR
jgi:hypothetical protein